MRDPPRIFKFPSSHQQMSDSMINAPGPVGSRMMLQAGAVFTLEQDGKRFVYIGPFSIDNVNHLEFEKENMPPADMISADQEFPPTPPPTRATRSPPPADMISAVEEGKSGANVEQEQAMPGRTSTCA